MPDGTEHGCKLRCAEERSIARETTNHVLEDSRAAQEPLLGSTRSPGGSEQAEAVEAKTGKRVTFRLWKIEVVADTGRLCRELWGAYATRCLKGMPWPQWGNERERGLGKFKRA